MIEGKATRLDDGMLNAIISSLIPLLGLYINIQRGLNPRSWGPEMGTATVNDARLSL